LQEAKGNYDQFLEMPWAAKSFKGFDRMASTIVAQGEVARANPPTRLMWYFQGPKARQKMLRTSSAEWDFVRRRTLRHHMQINAQFRDQSLSPTDFETVLNRLGKIIDSMADKHVDLVRSNWRLKGDSQEEASLYPVFDANEPSTAALAVLREEFRTSPNQTYVAIWDGNETSVAGVNMVCHVGQPGKLNSFAIEMVGEHRVDDLDSVTHILMQAVHEFAPSTRKCRPRNTSRSVFSTTSRASAGCSICPRSSPRSRCPRRMR